MHAWVCAWCGREAGWVEYDPTDACLAGDGHVVTARGRDYSDVAPVRGVLRSAGSQTSRHAVTMTPVGGGVRRAGRGAGTYPLPPGGCFRSELPGSGKGVDGLCRRH